MEKPNRSPLDQAYQDLPVGWYEKLVGKHLLLIYSSALTMSTYSLIYHDSVPLSARVAIGFLYLSGRTIDFASTKKVITAINEARENNVPIIHRERNPFYRRQIETSGRLRSPQTILVEGLAFVTCQFIPALSLSTTILSCTATLSNTKVARRYRRASELAQMH